MSNWILFYHDESECLFWSQSREGNEQCDEIGESPKKSRSTAENIWGLLPNRRSFPPFADIYKEKDEAPAPAAEAPRSASLFEAVPRWPGAPKVCEYENLPAFDSAKDAAAFLREVSPNQHAIEQWECPVCGKWHMLTGSPPIGHSEERAFSPRPPRAVREKLLVFAKYEEPKAQAAF